MLTWLIRLLHSVLDFFEGPPIRMSDQWIKENTYTAGKERR